MNEKNVNRVVIQRFGQLLLTYADYVQAALRTAGALLIGNSALVYFKVIGSGIDYTKLWSLGIITILVCSVPLGAVINLFKKG
jgi:hypothetical protein